MPWKTIIRYTSSAVLFAVFVTAVWLLIRRIILRKRLQRRDLPKLFTIGYLAAVLQIIGLRLFLTRPKWLGGRMRLKLLYTTTEQWKEGFGAFLYHVGGNMIWFVPLGALLARASKRMTWWKALLLGAGFSALLEMTQYLLGTGLTDVDDVLLNALGTLLGYGLAKLFKRK